MEKFHCNISRAERQNSMITFGRLI